MQACMNHRPLFLLFRKFCADFTNRIMERMGEIQYRFIGKRAERNLCSIEKLHVLPERKWIDAGGNPAVRHEGVPPSNNLIKDGTHRATVFVGPTLKSFSFCFRQIYCALYGGDVHGDQENSYQDWDARHCGSSIDSRSCTMDERSGRQNQNGQNEENTFRIRKSYCC